MNPNAKRTRQPEPVIVDDNGKAIGDAAIWDEMLGGVSPAELDREAMETAISTVKEDMLTVEEAAELYQVPVDDLRKRV